MPSAEAASTLVLQGDLTDESVGEVLAEIACQNLDALICVGDLTTAT